MSGWVAGLEEEGGVELLLQDVDFLLQVMYSTELPEIDHPARDTKTSFAKLLGWLVQDIFAELVSCKNAGGLVCCAHNSCLVREAHSRAKYSRASTEGSLQRFEHR